MSLSEAIEIVKQNQDLPSDKKKVDFRDSIFTILNAFTLNDKNGEPAIHSITYLSKGDTLFQLVHADHFVSPIIAYGEGIFIKDGVTNGISIWIGEQIALLEYIRENNFTYKQYLDEIVQAREEPDNNCIGQNYVYQKGPLMASRWGQGCYYNDNLEPCTSNCDHELTGCVATAVGQVMKYHNHPSNYDWSLILNIYSVSSTVGQIEEVATLMEDIGIAVDMDWGCASSGANTCEDVPDAFTETFGYSSANSCADYSFEPVRSDISQNRPVIFRGSNQSDAGHAWVCDGYKEGQVCDVVDGQVYSWLFFSLHMNWGWNGSQNGWYNYSNFNGFNTNVKYIKNIKP